MRTLLKLGIPFALFFIVTGPAVAQTQTATVISTRANLRETPSQSGVVKQEVPIDTEIKVLDNKGPWYVVRVADNVGWMHGNTFRFAGASATTSAETLASPIRTRTTSEDNSPTRSSTSSEGSYIEGPRGGCYYYSASGNKVYVDRSLCGSSSVEVAPVTSSNTPAPGGYNRGPRGGCYRYSRTGKKVYVDRSRCS